MKHRKTRKEKIKREIRLLESREHPGNEGWVFFRIRDLRQALKK